ncbi:hypothetical protein SCP_0406140 [Sparassis crispa]|uniref:Uncharacterized protein n=1 Tax=Sparassis crispa TaxID=139825 RepID=A0A401GJ99_9APHY|nr:hypothetical protein SCP_0406140 [Sparassis crispa]GBE82231.1 hypothetical protein SCP_0406140 [Sparassis crispa]
MTPLQPRTPTLSSHLGDTARLREVNGLALLPRPRTPLALCPFVLQFSHSPEEPPRGLRGDTAQLREVDGPTLAPPLHTPLALCPSISQIQRQDTIEIMSNIQYHYLDLVDAVVRQGSFIDKMYAFGWTEPGYFNAKEDELVLMHATARYHACVLPTLLRAKPTC